MKIIRICLLFIIHVFFVQLNCCVYADDQIDKISSINNNQDTNFVINSSGKNIEQIDSVNPPPQDKPDNTNYYTDSEPLEPQNAPFVLIDNNFTNNTAVHNDIKLAHNTNDIEQSNSYIYYKPDIPIKLEVTDNRYLSQDQFREITLDQDEFAINSIGDLNAQFNLTVKTDNLPDIDFSKPAVSPVLNRMKTLYFMMAVFSIQGEHKQISYSFIPGHPLEYNGRSTGEYYGYNNVARNLMNPIGRVIKGAKIDYADWDYNYIWHPAYGFGLTAYSIAAGASGKEALLECLAANLLFEYVVEGTYIAPSGCDILATTAGSVVGYLVAKYVLNKPFKKIIQTAGFVKDKTGMQFDPIIEAGYLGKGMKIGTRVTIKH